MLSHVMHNGCIYVLRTEPQIKHKERKSVHVIMHCAVPQHRIQIQISPEAVGAQADVVGIMVLCHLGLINPPSLNKRLTISCRAEVGLIRVHRVMSHSDCLC